MLIHAWQSVLLKCQLFHAKGHLLTHDSSSNTNENILIYKTVPHIHVGKREENVAKLSLMSPKSTDASTPPLPWEVVVLVAHKLDPKTLAIASCVSKSWYISMSSDHNWESHCITQYPSLARLKYTNPLIPYRRLYTMGHTAAKRRVKSPCKPRLSLDNIIFVIDLSTENQLIINSAKSGRELEKRERKGVFRFEFDVDVNYESWSSVDDKVLLEGVKISWNVVLKGWRAVFTMMECGGKVRIGKGGDGWFSEELPSPGCCFSDSRSGMVADMKVGFSSGRSRIGKVSLGILSIINWRYLSLEDGLRYLQHYLLP